MTKKNKVFDFITILLNFHPLPRKNGSIYYGFIALKIRDIIRKGIFNFANDKNIINYINSRNMRKTLTPSSLNEWNALQKIHAINKKEILNLVSLNLEQFKKAFFLTKLPNFFKFHNNSVLQGKAASNESKGEQEDRDQSWGGTEAAKLILHISNNFDEVMKNHDSVLVKFYAEWCPHCQRLKKVYGAAALMAKEAKLDTVFAAFDITNDPDTAMEKGVVGIPLIRYYENGKLVTNYRGPRTTDGFFQFVKNAPRKRPASQYEGY